MPFYWHANAKKYPALCADKIAWNKKVTTTIFSWSFSLANAAMTPSCKAAAVSNSTTRLTWHFSHVPSKQNRVYGPCFYLDYAPQAAKLHQSNFLLGLLLREKKEVMRSTGGMSYHVLLTLFPPFSALLLKNIYWQATRNFWVASLALYPFQIGPSFSDYM